MQDQLLDAAWDGDLIRIREALGAGADVNAVDDGGETALMKAAGEGHPEAVRLLLQAGTDVNLKTGKGTTALFLACSDDGNPEVVRLLLEAGADPEAVSGDLFDQTPLHYACWEGQAEIARLLLQAGAAVDARDPQGNTALIKAAGMGHAAAARVLLEAGADINARNDSGGTALMAAAVQGNGELAQLLVDHGAALDPLTEEGWSALLGAVRHGRLRAARALIRAGADVNAANRQGLTPLLDAARNGRRYLVRLLLQAGADPNVAYQDYDEWFEELAKGMTPLMIAAQKGDDRMVEMLLAAGADVDARNERGRTALELAAGKGFSAIVERLRDAGAAAEVDEAAYHAAALLKASAAGDEERVTVLLALGADPNTRQEENQEKGYTPLIYAAARGHVKVARLLIDAGADVHTSNTHLPFFNAARPVLLHAAEGGSPEIVELMLEAGADVDARSTDGETALLLAAAGGHAEAVGILLAAGADPNARDSESGQTAFQAAVSAGHREAVRALLEVAPLLDASALVAAARVADLEAMQALLATGMDVNTCAEGGDDEEEGSQTPLIAAIEISTKIVVRGPGVDLLDEDSRDKAGWLAEVNRRRLEAIRLLLEAGADVHARDTQGRTPLIAAAMNGTSFTVRCEPDSGTQLHTYQETDPLPVVRLLLEAGARLEDRDHEGCTALLRAAAVDRWSGCPILPTVQALLEVGADVNARNQEDETPLHLAVAQEQLATVEALLQAGADPNARDQEGRTPLIVAVRHHSEPRLVRLLLSAGADPDVSDEQGNTALDMAREWNQDEAADLLRQAGAGEEEPIHRELREAVEEDDEARVGALLAAGADPHRPSFGKDALLIAVSGGRLAIARMLVERGVDLDRSYASRHDMTLLMVAAEAGHTGIVKLLLEAGADPNATTWRGWSALMVAAACRRRETVDILLAGGAQPDRRAADFLEQFSFAERAQEEDFQAAVQELTAICDASAREIEWLPGAFAFRVTAGAETEERLLEQASSRWLAEYQALQEKVESILQQTHSDFLARGYHVVDLGRPIGCGPAGNFIGLLPTTNKLAVIAAIGVSPDEMNVFDVVDWFRALDQEEPFILNCCRYDTVDITFLQPVKDPENLARRMYAFCPDLVDQGTETLERLVEQLRERQRVRFWWD